MHKHLYGNNTHNQALEYVDQASDWTDSAQHVTCTQAHGVGKGNQGPLHVKYMFYHRANESSTPSKALFKVWKHQIVS